MSFTRPLFKRFQNREVYSPRASVGGKYNNTGVQSVAFSGELSLNNPLGTLWNDLAQTGAINITVGQDAEEGGCDSVRIVSNGSAITLDAAFTWINMGSDSLGANLADVNEIIFLCKKLTRTPAGVITAGTILYGVKLNP